MSPRWSAALARYRVTGDLPTVLDVHLRFHDLGDITGGITRLHIVESETKGSDAAINACLALHYLNLSVAIRNGEEWAFPVRAEFADVG